ncbi:MAG: cysteine dioxygenase family protein [Candidatus Solibacter usitatus]|nr:cysteine dioxygenase family protein [Candidatus Solibacter usitatus]
MFVERARGRPKASSYARRLLYRDPALGVTAVVMTWGAGQSTPVHDHAGIWCVEGVVLGRMDVIQYELQEEEAERVRFTRRDCVHATVGQAGCLIPPFEHHVLANVSGQTSITLHIYGGEMSTCNIYLPLEGDWYQRQSRGLHYDE